MKARRVYRNGYRSYIANITHTLLKIRVYNFYLFCSVGNHGRSVGNHGRSRIGSSTSMSGYYSSSQGSGVGLSGRWYCS